MGLDSTNILLLDQKIRAAGIPIHGLNTARQIHFNAATPAQETLGQQIADGFGLLEITVDNASIAADGIAAATVTCNDALILGDVNLDYAVYASDGNLELTGNIPVIAGSAAYAFRTRIADKYLILFSRQGFYETGTLIVEAK